ncbi:hypothetical protein J31TS4_29990 [Paenibacillus sp. J31TS4]|uniref:hypothetical protein n=1 Tax=Paenibacillus sp. J31TS4 TaxID=2807195 RepID=UPI001B0F2895|nr:hypothetical protein [Paenibacillus sp. J31TS4]GIP39719.1 hypothetical protein J31TS4_29990 [Paenibacillus sp. J31TS4]
MVLPMFRSSRKVFSLLLVLALVVSSISSFFSLPSAASAATPDRLFFDFESFKTGPLQGQQGWNADAKTTVTAEVYHSGTRSVRITDDDPTKAFGPFLNFSPLTEGKIEWWAKTDSRARLITQLQSYSPSGTLTAEWAGFNSTGNFVYYDGATKVDTGTSYDLDTWYRFTVAFDATRQTKTLLISDENGPIYVKEGTAFRDAGMASVNRLRFSTISTDTGVFHIDDIRIRDRAQDDPAELTGLALVNRSYTLKSGQTANLQVVGSYAGGGINVLRTGNSYVSSAPDIVEALPDGRLQAHKAGQASVTVTNSVYGDTATVRVLGAEEPLPAKPIEPRPLERETDLTALTIVTPAEAEWRQAGDRLAARLNEKWGVTARVTASDESEVGDGWAGNVLVLGNLGNNAHIARLYGLYLSYTDAVHPGKGGYQLQTLIDPFGKGGNTLLLGASDLTGLQAGADRLDAMLGGLSSPALPWLSETVIAPEAAAKLPYGANPTADDVVRMKAEFDLMIAKLVPDSTDELDANHLLSLFSKLTYYGKLYQLTSAEGYGEGYRYLWQAYSSFLNRYPKVAQGQLASKRNMWTNGYATIGSYTVMEASPLFDEAERSQFASALYLTYEANTRDGYLVSAPETGARYNHDVFPALSLIFGASYFQKYYGFPEMAGWYRLGERIFRGNTSNINLDEGSDYLMHVPGITLEYAMATGDERFLAKGLRPSADLNAMMIDNLGTMSGGGDVYPFGRSSAYSWNHSQVMNAASWFFEEPLYQFLLERTRTGPFPGQNMSDLDFPFHRFMTDKAQATELTGDYPAVQAFPVEQGVYDELKKDLGGSLEVPIDETFHKLAFREGYRLEDSYLMLDGFSDGKHGHMDGNTIIKYSANGRIFIDDRDYIEKAPKNHTGLLVIKDGVQEAKPPLTRLEWAADAGGIGISRSETPSYNGADWTRSIVSPGGRFYLIYDDVEMKEDGRYALEATWQTLGSLTLAKDRFKVEQEGVQMSLQSLDDSHLRQYERYGHFIKYWKTVYPYPYADEEHVLREVKEEKAYRAGEVSRFVNVLSSGSSDERAVQAKRLDDATIRIEEADGSQWFARWGAVEADGFRSNGKFHLIGPSEALIAEATQVVIGGETLAFEQPVLLKLNLTDGSWTAYRMTKGMTRYDEAGQPINDGTVGSGTLQPSHGKLAGLLLEIKRSPVDPHPGKPGQGPKRDEAPGEGSPKAPQREKVYSFGEPVTHSSSGDIDGDGQTDLLLGGASGKVQAIGADGTLLWTFAAKGRVNEVTVQDVDGVPMVFVATENWYVQVLDAGGTELWNKEIPNGPEHREQKGNLLGVTNIRVAHMNGVDKEPWIMVGTQFRYLYGFDLHGSKQYEDIAYFYGIEDMEFLDLDGDGKDEGVLGLEYYYYSFLNDGVLTRYGGSRAPGPGYKVVEPLASWSGSLQAAVALGTKQNRVHLFQFNGKPKELWSRNVGGEVNDIRAGDFDGDGRTELLVASDGFQLYLIEADGSVRWHTTLGDRVLRAEAVQTAQGLRYLAVTDNGGVYTVKPDGVIEAKETYRGLVNDVHPGTGPDRAWIVLESGEVYRTKHHNG